MKIKTKLWVEDDATVQCRDHEGPHAAYLRLTGRRLQSDLESALEVEDGGDATLYRLPGGLEVLLSYPGASEIYRVEDVEPFYGELPDYIYLMLDRRLTGSEMAEFSRFFRELQVGKVDAALLLPPGIRIGVGK